MNRHCRPAEAGDAAALAAIDARCSPSPWSESYFRDLSASAGHTLVIEERGSILGFLVFHTVLDESTLLNIAVSPDHRRRGLARQLMEEMLSLLRQQGAHRSLLEVRRSNVAAISLYLSWGFAEDGVRKGYYPLAGGREDALLMSLQLEDES